MGWRNIGLDPDSRHAARPSLRSMPCASEMLSAGVALKDLLAERLGLGPSCKAVIKMIIERRSPTMRHVSRTHRVALDWLFDSINLEPKIQNQICGHQKTTIADILTKGSFSRDEWDNLLRLVQNYDFSMYSCRHFSDFRFDDQVREQSAMSKKEVKRRLRTKALRWRNRDHAW